MREFFLAAFALILASAWHGVVMAQSLPPCTIEAQRRGLLAIYDELKGDQWLNSSGWNTVEDGCNQDNVRLNRLVLHARCHVLNDPCGHAHALVSCSADWRNNCLLCFCSSRSPTTAAGLA